MTEGTGLRRAAEATDGDARPVGNCETEDSGCPHDEQVAAPSSTSEAQLGQRITRGILRPERPLTPEKGTPGDRFCSPEIAIPLCSGA